ncbi:hydroxymethylglutaryl-lyase [Lasallia pustulata]|uniref:hydroxymethylglutaryl-CoA lyase n=1 Tax=Lasallia pustulata TaxID=136370 RepID=A0A1W5D2F9_9LECA|nr:hydroxymethylglutaryl-lyase [Lasallia pustulata]
MASLKAFRCTQSLCRQLCNRTFATSARRLAEEVRIVEVGPRDGLQNEKNTVPLKTKLELIQRLATTGVRDIEAGSFVAPKWVPQMANSAEVLNHILGHSPPASNPIAYNFLVPNLKGLENFIKASGEARNANGENAPITSPKGPDEQRTPPPSPKAEEQEVPASNTSTQDPNEMPSINSGVDSPFGQRTSSPLSTEVSLFAAATEAFSRANTNCSIAESLERCKPIVALAKYHNIRVRGYVSVALGCPYEGPDVSPSKVAELTASLLEMGADEVSVADTTGMGTAPRTQELLKALSAAGIANKDLALHFHDTYGQALVNAVVGLEHGVRTFDSAVGGLGGCPYSKGATGNVATEDLVYCLHSLGATTGVDVEKMAEIGAWITKELGRANDSRAGKALLAKMSL